MTTVEKQQERRQHRRYILRGRAECTVDSLELWGDLVNFGQGGMLIQSRFSLPERMPLRFRILPFCFPEPIDVAGEVVGGCDSLTAIHFLENTNGIQALIGWLEQEHFPWTGGNPAESAGQTASAAAGPESAADREEVERFNEEIFRHG